MAPLQLSATGYGESRPIANNETAEGRLRNRRIDVVIYP
jgi:chemotaxis protein MotB